MSLQTDLAPISDGDEESFALEFEEPALATLGFAYEERGRLSGGAYHGILRKVDRWLPGIPGVSPRSSSSGFERARALGVAGRYELIPGALHGIALRARGGRPVPLPRARAWERRVAAQLATF